MATDDGHDYDATRRSWNHATRNHNAHKGDQAARLRAGDDTLFDEELDLLGPLHGRALVHLQCNAGQDTLCLARRGADALGVDLSALRVSSRDPADVARVRRALVDRLHGDLPECDLVVPYDRGSVVGEIRDSADVLRESFEDDGVHYRVRAPQGTLDRLAALLGR